MQVDEQKVTKMADFIGRFPVVIMSSDDLNLLRGAPAERRRCFDLIFSAGNSSTIRFCKATIKLSPIVIAC